jgi:hypothetical protein
MKDPACPYCYHRIPGGVLWFACQGRGSPGREGCLLINDSEHIRETNFNEPIRFAFAPPTGLLSAGGRRAKCPRCGGETGDRACPCCHTPLSTNYGDSTSPLIAMVGATGTGKTVYLTVLAHELINSIRRRFQAAIWLIGDGHGTAASPRQWLNDNVQLLYKNRQLLPKTPVSLRGRQQPLVFEWRRPTGNRAQKLLARWGGPSRTILKRESFRTSYLSFYDTAGEDLLSHRSANDLAYVGAADAMILLLDPFMLGEARTRLRRLPKSAITSIDDTIDVVGRVTESLRSSHGVAGSERIQLPLAVAFAKIDAILPILNKDHYLRQMPTSAAHYDEIAGRDAHEHLKALVHDLGGDDVDLFLEQNYANFRYFGVSALGAEPDYDQGTVESGGVRPFRVDEPLVWLLSQFGVVERRSGE